MPWLIGLALLVRAFVPTGWMTASAADGGVILVPCSGLMPAPAPAADPMPMHGGHHEAAAAPHHGDHGSSGQQDHEGKAQQLCTFAGLAFAWTGAEPPPLLAPVRVEPPVARPAQFRVTGRGLAAPPPPATGPPHSA